MRWSARVLVNGGWRWGRASPVLLCCAALLALTVLSGGARARPVTAHAARCGSSNSSSFGLIGRGDHLVSEVDMPVCVTGRLTVTFAGDPATGCATEGLCGYSGTETFSPGSGNVGDLNVITTARHGHRSTSATLFVGGPGSPLTSAVQRTVSTPTGTRTTACSDNVGGLTNLGGELFTLGVRGGRATIDLAHGQQPLLGSRCAGPLDVDLASAMPSRTVALGTLQRGETTIDLMGHGPFAAHGLTGTVSSTLVLTLGRPQHERQTPAVPKGPTQVRVAHSATVGYRITRLSGSAVSTVQSSAMPAVCGPFDACGLGGTITVIPGALARGSVFLSTAGLGSRAPDRELRAQLRGAGPASTRLLGAGQAGVRGTVQAALTQGGGACSDSVALHQFTLRLARVGHWLTVSLAPSVSQAADPLRTRCPGPDLGTQRFAAASVPAAVLGRPAFTVRLSGRAFSAGPYRVTTRSTLALTLRRGATHVRVIRIILVKERGTARAKGRARITRGG
ncbi:MAG: hypothetical protein ACRDK8_14440 [Solirubrobacteraceae bacterium]